MKVIVEGNINARAWWVGRKAMCDGCGRVVELERGDDDRADWFWNHSANEVRVDCPTCKGMMTVRKGGKHV